MKLGGGSKGKTMLESLIKEDHLVSVPSSKKSTGTGVEAVVPAAVVAASVHPVTLSVEERLSCQVSVVVFLALALLLSVKGHACSRRIHKEENMQCGGA